MPSALRRPLDAVERQGELPGGAREAAALLRESPRSSGAAVLGVLVARFLVSFDVFLLKTLMILQFSTILHDFLVSFDIFVLKN